MDQSIKGPISKMAETVKGHEESDVLDGSPTDCGPLQKGSENLGGFIPAADLQNVKELILNDQLHMVSMRLVSKNKIIVPNKKEYADKDRYEFRIVASGNKTLFRPGDMPFFKSEWSASGRELEILKINGEKYFIVEEYAISHVKRLPYDLGKEEFETLMATSHSVRANA